MFGAAFPSGWLLAVCWQAARVLSSFPFWMKEVKGECLDDVVLSGHRHSPLFVFPSRAFEETFSHATLSLWVLAFQLSAVPSETLWAARSDGGLSNRCCGWRQWHRLPRHRGWTGRAGGGHRCVCSPRQKWPKWGRHHWRKWHCLFWYRKRHPKKWSQQWRGNEWIPALPTTRRCSLWACFQETSC